MNFIFVGPMHIQYRTPAGRTDSYSEVILAKLLNIIKLAQQYDAQLVFAEHFVERNLDKTMIAPICRAFLMLEHKPVVLLSAKELVGESGLPVSHPLTILESAGLVHLIKPGECQIFRYSKSAPPLSVFNEISKDTILKASSDIVLMTQQMMEPSSDFRLILSTRYGKISDPSGNITLLTDVGRKRFTGQREVSVLLLDPLSSQTETLTLDGVDPEPFDAVEVDAFDNTSSEFDSNPVTTLTQMLKAQREREACQASEIEERLMGVIEQMEADEIVSPDAIEIIHELWHETEPEVVEI
jgi:hypothetical protein